MEACCFDYYSECSGLSPCFETLSVRVPDSYTDPNIKLKFYKGSGDSSVVVEVEVTIVGGIWANVLITDVPAGFFNPFSNYKVEMWEDNGFHLLSFQAKDGKTYQGIKFQFDNMQQPITYITVNAITNQYYD